MRKKTQVVKIGNVAIGGENPVAIQSMTKTDTKDIEATVAQIQTLTDAGCQIVRSAIYDEECARCIPAIKDAIRIPFVADVHFDAHIAVAAIECGVDKIRINPGNIGDKDKIVSVVDAAKAHHIPIRVGANSGSIPADVLEQYGKPTADALIESALQNIRILEKQGFTDIVVAIKSSNVNVCVEAYRKISKILDYPLHLGVTEAGTCNNAIIKSSVALGALLLDGIGDTFRVSVTGDPVQEIAIAKEILDNIIQ
ncbi:MAG: (E)-4-hydroxy-3-methylbut-2-enyl-diphosphate synthase [Christensenella sp.]|uniref:(E)-4-hydroxy-3-methylbut-2-enyl-diphosphate synthase n=1 Tax=Christensenella sp. TaxID=1935934 RepID=UPI002B20FE93|nr:(E)-4-hydroxy-3-methylbut-2-enyl-diphosphate synthase [Christensenella sp.]MEA5002865.1 (E)-4-hydroxy-3-methylbut-2-enyl-diphosphate synthase [Christensenella sp.]